MRCGPPFASLLLLSSGCHDLFDGVFPYVCEDDDGDQASLLPEKLSDTGLYADIEAGDLAPGVLPYTPRFGLWSDGASKRRWILIPDGERIDTGDPDDWDFPRGTKAWKEFSRDGVVVETRLLAKLGPRENPWIGMAYVWGEDGDAHAAKMGYLDARGTPHDVPAPLECRVCHGGRRSFLLGVSAVQLAEAPSDEGLDLEQLQRTDRLTTPVDVPSLPGNSNTRRALGYLHANCGHCHNDAAPHRECFDPQNGLDFWLRTDALGSVSRTPTYQSAVPEVILPGNPGDSAVVQHMSTRDLFTRMPPLGSREVDPEGIELVRTFIRGLE